MLNTVAQVAPQPVQDPPTVNLGNVPSTAVLVLVVPCVAWLVKNFEIEIRMKSRHDK